MQDAGRPGLRRYGIPTSGALDQFSYRVANALVGNPPEAAALEIMLPGLVVEALTDIVVAVTGGDFGVPMWQSLVLRQGERLQFTKRLTGCRAYLAVRGGLDTEEFLGSKSVFAKGLMGAPLKAGATLSVAGFRSRAILPPRSLPVACRPSFPSEYVILATRGPQVDRFTATGIETFLKSPYKLSPRSDRQGFRAEGAAIETANGSDIISDPTPLGAIQVPGDGQPIILHRDGQVTGGYAKIGTVISADLDKFGQMMPGDSLRFAFVTRDEAMLLAEQVRRRMAAVLAMLG